MRNSCFLLVCWSLISFSEIAQSQQTAQSQLTAQSQQSALARNSGSVTSSESATDLLLPSWNTQLLNSFGIQPLSGAFNYQRWLKDAPSWGYTLQFSWTKSSDSTAEETSTTINVGSLTQTQGTTYSGVKNPEVLTLGAGFKNRIFSNPWIKISWGGELLYSQTSKVSYRTGSVSISTPNINTPGDYTVTESNLGDESLNTGSQIFWGPRFGAEFYIKWFPNLALYGEASLLTSLNRKNTTTRNTVSRAYSVVGGVAQAPSSESSSTVVRENQLGYSRSLSSVGSSYFNLFSSNWGLRYNW
jgi:hypothetical protein